MSMREARRGMGPCLVSAPREAQRCLVIQQVAAFQLWSHALAKQASKQAAAACACCWRRQLWGNLHELPSAYLPITAHFPDLTRCLGVKALVLGVSLLLLLSYVACS